MHIQDFGKPSARSLAKAIRAAADARVFLTLEPGEYHLDEPVRVELDQNVTRTWGVQGLGAYLIVEYTEPDPALLLDAVGNAVVRFLVMDGITMACKGQPGIVLQCLGGTAYLYSFSLQRLSVEGADDALRLEGNVFEGDIAYPSFRNSNCGLALGNTDTGILSAVNVFGGTISQNWVDGVRTFAQTCYREPYDFSMFGTYCGNNGRYSINALAGVMLLKGCRLENPWTDPAKHDPDGTAERACVNVANFATLEQVIGGGNGNGTTLVNGYMSGTLAMRDCRMTGASAKRLAKVDGAAGNAFCVAERCTPPVIEASKAVRVSMAA
jgi:hypothetical protein